MRTTTARAMTTWVLMGCLSGLAACGGEGDEEDDLAEGGASEALMGDNALSLNALSLNALSLNALSLNALSLNTLSPENLGALLDPTPAGGLSRELARYLVSCALEDGQSLDFTWAGVDGVVHEESLPGRLGLAPRWASKPLDPPSQRLVSACVAARVNFYGQPVTISLRSSKKPLKTSAWSEEVYTYPAIEGAFWGNLFDREPALHACHHTWNVSHSRSRKRDCAAGHEGEDGEILECGPIRIVGSCALNCQPLSTGWYYPGCLERPGSSLKVTKEVITTALP
ncbi:hypothetical protein [Chondromyces apiculatus]|uniref:Lipoprotein n=1 Tax=Chondromyces apiculatus DSM 436 TaxID=1192034 RepID=A0A017T2C3_9BACT|nr:hypothetical protein [Chondromyces apiculatus]EYF03117.1 Hypothetical protein CAP_6231 [Chondromyces apiculatus DSM 436]